MQPIAAFVALLLSSAVAHEYGFGDYGSGYDEVYDNFGGDSYGFGIDVPPLENAYIDHGIPGSYGRETEVAREGFNIMQQPYGDIRNLGKQKIQNLVVPQPMEFHNVPFAQPSVGGYRPPQQQQYVGSVGVAPYTTVIETDDRLRLSSVMEANDPVAHRQLGKHKYQQIVPPQPMEFHNLPYAELSVGGYRPSPLMLNGQPAQAVNVAPWTSIIETDDRLRLTSVMNEGGVEVHSAKPRGIQQVREVPLYTWSRVENVGSEL